MTLLLLGPCRRTASYRFTRTALWCRYDPVSPAAPEQTVVAADEALVAAYFELPDEELDVNRMSPWLLRIELDRCAAAVQAGRKWVGGTAFPLVGPLRMAVLRHRATTREVFRGFNYLP